MRLSAIVLSVFALLAFSGTVQAGRKAPLLDPPPVRIPSALTDADVAKSIKLALVGRGWQITAEQAGEIQSSLHLREHVAKIRITWEQQEIRIAYVDSTNLDYKLKNGKPQIHTNYLNWINYVVQDLNIKLRTKSVENGGNGN
jgi:hypothetical protein